MAKFSVFKVLIALILLLLFSGCVQQQNQKLSEAVCGNNLAEERETCSTCAADVKCQLNEKCVSDKCIPKKAISLEKDLTYKCSEICASNEFCNSSGACEKVELTNVNYCGNFVCEAGEKYDGKVMKTVDMGKQCYYDCSSPANSEYTNDSVEVDCGCSEYEAMADRHGCINDAKPCTDCGIQESLFPEVLKIQTEIYNCLVDYFKFKPQKLIYKVFNNPNLEKCKEQGGCTGIEGGVGGADYVMFHNLDGFRAYDEVVPTKPEHLQADVHETTHFFIYQMLHGIPSWFHEVVAIQTNERLYCNDKQAEWGDSYLPEKEGTGGINMADGTSLNLDFYKRLKNGKTSLSEEEKKDHYFTAVLFLLGLKEDYGCGFYCIRDIVLKLHEYELKKCSTDANACANQKFPGDIYMAMWIGGSEEKANELIMTATSEVTGKDVTPLFNFLEIGKYEALPSSCGPTSTCTK